MEKESPKETAAQNDTDCLREEIARPKLLDEDKVLKPMIKKELVHEALKITEELAEKNEPPKPSASSGLVRPTPVHPPDRQSQSFLEEMNKANNFNKPPAPSVVCPKPVHAPKSHSFFDGIHEGQMNYSHYNTPGTHPFHRSFSPHGFPGVLSSYSPAFLDERMLTPFHVGPELIFNLSPSPMPRLTPSPVPPIGAHPQITVHVRPRPFDPGPHQAPERAINNSPFSPHSLSYSLLNPHLKAGIGSLQPTFPHPYSQSSSQKLASNFSSGEGGFIDPRMVPQVPDSGYAYRSYFPSGSNGIPGQPSEQLVFAPKLSLFSSQMESTNDSNNKLLGTGSSLLVASKSASDDMHSPEKEPAQNQFRVTKIEPENSPHSVDKVTNEGKLQLQGLRGEDSTASIPFKPSPSLLRAFPSDSRHNMLMASNGPMHPRPGSPDLKHSRKRPAPPSPHSAAVSLCSSSVPITDFKKSDQDDGSNHESDGSSSKWHKQRHRDYSKAWRQKKKQEEHVLKEEIEQLRKFRTMVEDSPDMLSLISTDPGYPFIFANAAHDRQLQIQGSGLVGRPFTSILHHLDKAAFSHTLDQICLLPEPPSVSYRVVNAQLGHIFLVESNFRRVPEGLIVVSSVRGTWFENSHQGSSTHPISIQQAQK